MKHLRPQCLIQELHLVVIISSLSSLFQQDKMITSAPQPISVLLTRTAVRAVSHVAYANAMKSA